MAAKFVETKKDIPEGMSGQQLTDFIAEIEGRRAGTKCKVVEEGSKRVLVCRYEKKKPAADGK